jgi:ABC-type multidrug transport system ATPase subunit
MQNFVVKLESPPPKGFRSIKAAQSVDLNIEQKLTHKLEVTADVQSEFNVGVIIGASGSGKTTLAKQIYGNDCFKEVLDLQKPVIEQFPDHMSYEDAVKALTGIGLSQVPCWVKPAGALSNGQKARAEAALQLCADVETVVIDEFTSVVDRNVAKVMAHCVQKYARKLNKRIVLVSCHYDIFEWLNPDWVIDCNDGSYTNRRSLRQDYKRTEKIQFDIAPCSRKRWSNFSKYHYLSDRLPGGHIETFGVYLEGEQIGFQCFANYVPHRKGTTKIMHSNRTVIHPDYVGFGMGMEVIDLTSKYMVQQGYQVMAKFSSVPVFNSMSKHPDWELTDVSNNTSSGQMNSGPGMGKKTGFRQKTRTFSFKYVG